MDTTTFFINGKQYSAGPEFGPNYTLADYIREEARLRATKVMCREGGCGLCTVTVSMFDPTTQKNITRPINACLCPIHTVNGWQVTTSEGLGNKKNGYHPIQDRLVKHFGTQCGFCTPGFVMNMYGFLCENPNPDKESVEAAMDGNICRCTGYRSIMDAMKSFSEGEPGTIDIEDIHKFACPKKENSESSECSTIQLKRAKWHRPATLDKLFSLFNTHAQDRVKLVLGNTAAGVYKGGGGNVYIDLRDIPDLCTVQTGENGLTIGANVSLTDFIKHGKSVGEKDPNYWYFADPLESYFNKIGGTALRNAGSWAGNLMMKHARPDFPSDLTPIFDAMACTIRIGSASGQESVNMENFLKMDMKSNVIISITLPPLPKDKFYFTCHKIMSRAAATYAIVNAGCLLEYNKDKSVNNARVAFGGLAKQFSFAKNASSYLNGKSLSAETIQATLNLLKDEMQLDEGPLLKSAAYRRNAAIMLLYRFLQNACDDTKAGQFMERPVTSGQQDYENITANYPANNSVAKYNSLLQTSGEAEYIGDMPKAEGELTAVPVLSTVAKAKIASIDISQATKVDGVVKVILAADIPGRNDLFKDSAEPYEVIASEKISFSGQVVAVVVADNKASAYVAAWFVKVTYKDVEKPVTDLKEAIEKKYLHSTEPKKSKLGAADDAMSASDLQIEGESKVGSQYHFFLEPQTCFCIPTDDGMDVYPSTQDPNGSQRVVSEVLGEPCNSVHVSVKRIGGGFGGKIGGSMPTTAMCAVAARLTDKPVRLALDLNRNIEMNDKRFGQMIRYKVGVNKDGRINAIIATMYLDGGALASPLTEYFLTRAMKTINGPYTILNWKLEGLIAKTDTAVKGPMRSPEGQGVCLMLENMFEHVATVLGKPAIELKKMHLCKNGDPSLLKSTPEVNCLLPELWAEVMKTAEVERRQAEIHLFNQANKWRKKGLAMVPARYLFGISPSLTYPGLVCIYAADGTVAVNYGGIEMGQGIHTKIAQICAKFLGVPLDDVRINPTRTDVSANTALSAGSMTPELATRTIMECCKILSDRLRGMREHNPGISWKELVQKAHLQGIDLVAHYKFTDVTTPDGPISYNIYGVAVGEAEVDILTGEHRCNRLDVLFDAGESINAEVDVGQVEGAFINGLGYMLTEKEVFDPDTGRLLTNGSWEYKVPLAKDIPVDMRITIKRNVPNPAGVTRAKAVGEPPIMMTPVFYAAIKEAIYASRRERGISDYFILGQPATPDVVHQSTHVQIEHLF